MRLSKREKNSIIIVLCFYILLFFVLLYYAFFYFYPNIIKIEENKSKLRDLYNNKVSIEKKGLSYNDFISLNKDTKNVYLSNVLSNISQDFYNKNFINNGSGSFNEFIIRTTKEINNPENQEKLLLQNSYVSKILPSYLENDNGQEDKVMTNFRFVNYIESILETFNLKSSDKIGISSVVLLGDYQQLKGKNNSLDVNIFSLPLKLSIKGKKEAIINFIYFAQHVGNVNVNDGLSVYSDEFLKTKYGDIILKGDYYNKNTKYNIYNNQVFDIEYIKFGNYIDSSTDLRGKTDFIEFLKSTQSNEDYSVDLKLNFYVKGIQQFELKSYITSILDKYFDLNTKVSSKLKNTDLNTFDLIKYKKASIYLNEINKDMVNIKKELQKSTSFEQIYSKIIKYNTPLAQIEKLINND